jgi:signal transduction histidine kinase
MFNNSLNILLIEDNLAEVRLLQELLLTKHSTEFIISHVKTLKEGLAKIKNRSAKFDVILLDLTLPDSHGLDSLEPIMTETPSTPIVILTNQNDDELAIEAVSRGAQDYLVKRMINPELLYRSLNYAIERKLNQEALLKANQELIAINQRLREEIQERRQIQASLAHKNAELEQFTYVVSHDLKQPLTTICGWIQMLEFEFEQIAPMNDKATKYFNYVVNSTKKMAQMIDVLLQYSRLETNPQQFQLVNCNEILQDAQERLEMTIAVSHAEIISEELPTIKADPVLLLQVFQNLIDNAIKYRSDKPLQIKISAQLTEESEREKWLFSFQDNGIGIEKEAQKNVFMVFKRVHPEGNQAGSGIGLATCEKVIKLHGGKIWLESTTGVGSTFYFTIPNG